MGFSVRRGTDAVQAAIVLAINAVRRSSGVVGSNFHADVTSDTTGDYRTPTATAATVGAANATDLATSLTLVNQIRQRWLQHMVDDLAHKVADTANTLAAAVATDLASAITLANEVKADFNLHIASTTFHYNADGTNTVATTNASDQSTLNALVNAIKTAFNAHIASAPAGQSIKLLEP